MGVEGGGRLAISCSFCEMATSILIEGMLYTYVLSLDIPVHFKINTLVRELW